MILFKHLSRTQINFYCFQARMGKEATHAGIMSDNTTDTIYVAYDLIGGLSKSIKLYLQLGPVSRTDLQVTGKQREHLYEVS